VSEIERIVFYGFASDDVLDKVSPEDRTPPRKAWHKYRRANQAKCSGCGVEVPEGSVFCPECEVESTDMPAAPCEDPWPGKPAPE
jgi:hypothetical protein